MKGVRPGNRSHACVRERAANILVNDERRPSYTATLGSLTASRGDSRRGRQYVAENPGITSHLGQVGDIWRQVLVRHIKDRFDESYPTAHCAADALC